MSETAKHARFIFQDAVVATQNNQDGVGHRLRADIRRQAAMQMRDAMVCPSWADGYVGVVITIVGRHAMDDDNAAWAVKPYRDAVADWLGRDDAHETVQWAVVSRRAMRGAERCVVVDVEERADARVTARQVQALMGMSGQRTKAGLAWWLRKVVAVIDDERAEDVGGVRRFTGASGIRSDARVALERTRRQTARNNNPASAAS